MLETWTFGVDGQANGSVFNLKALLFFNVTQPVLGTTTNRVFHRHGRQKNARFFIWQHEHSVEKSGCYWSRGIKWNEVLFYLRFKAPIQKPNPEQTKRRSTRGCDVLLIVLQSTRKEHLKMEKKEGEWCVKPNLHSRNCFRSSFG